MNSARRDLPEKMSNPDALAWMGRREDVVGHGKPQLESQSRPSPPPSTQPMPRVTSRSITRLPRSCGAAVPS
jgi:hypothetical protein